MDFKSAHESFSLVLRLAKKIVSWLRSLQSVILEGNRQETSFWYRIQSGQTEREVCFSSDLPGDLLETGAR